MEAKLQRQKERESALSSLNKAIGALDLAGDDKGTKPAKEAFDSASLLLAAIRDSVIDKADCVELGIICAEACQALDRGLRGRRADQHSPSVLDAIYRLNMTMAEIKGHVVKRGKRNAIAQRFHAKNDKEAVASWKLRLVMIRGIFEAELAISADVDDNQCGASDTQNLPDPVDVSASASAIHRDVGENYGDKYARPSTYASAPDESLPPLARISPRAISTDVRHDVVKTRTMVSQVQREVGDTHSIVTEIHQNLLKIRENNGHQSRAATSGVKSSSTYMAINNYHTITPRSNISAVVHGLIRVFYQALDGTILRGEWSNCRWSHFRHQHIDAVPLTPLACTSWMQDKEIRMYYLDRQYILQEYCYSEGVGWYAGDVGKMNCRASTDTRLSAVNFCDPEGGINVRVYYQEPGSQAIVELRNDGYWTKGNRLLDALDGTSIAAVAMNWNGGITIRVYYQAEDLSLKEYCHDSGRGQYPGEWNHGKAPSRSPINAAAHEIDGELCIWVCWRNHQEEIVINKYHRFWGPVTRVVRSVPSDSQFALVQWVDGKYTQLRLYYQNDANLVCEQCSDDGGDNWWSGYKWGATRKVVLQLPHYARFFKDEQNLPQHELSLPSPEGKDGRYLWVSNQHSGFGWGNIFGPLCMMSLVAYLSNRAFVFEPYTWHVGDEPYVEHKHEKRLIVSRVPLTALISGPLAGGSFPAGDNHPRSVNKEFYKQVSEGRDVAHLSIKELNEGLEGRPAIEILEKYVQALKDASEDCVELFGSREHPFDYIQFGDAEIQTVYKQLSESPFITEFNWSSLVLSALGHNTSIICPLLPKSGLDLSDPELKFADPVEIASVLPHYIPDLLVLHVRRGDYERHWHFLCTCNSLFCGWNRVPGMGDVFNPKEEEGTKEEIYKKHAYPSDEQIVKKVGEVREKWETGQQGERKLCRLYIATNGTQEETAKLKKALRQAGAWDVIASTYDLALDHEQQYVAYAIDSAIAERAGVFIGTGFSSMSANINFMRRVHGLPLQSSRFW